jgi:hypothetical protein
MTLIDGCGEKEGRSLQDFKCISGHCEGLTCTESSVVPSTAAKETS